MRCHYIIKSLAQDHYLVSGARIRTQQYLLPEPLL